MRNESFKLDDEPALILDDVRRQRLQPIAR